MAKATRITAATANLMLDAGIGTVANSGKLRVYSGTQPATPETAVGIQVKLLEFTLNVDAFPAAASGVLTANAIATALGLANGTATWYRLLRSNGTTVIMDGSAGMVAGATDLVINDTAILIGDVISVLSYEIAQPLQ